MGCCLVGAKPLPEPVLTFSQLDPYDNTAVKFASKYRNFIHKNAFKRCLWNGDSFYPGGDELIKSEAYMVNEFSHA